jgi:hypothetical protein
MGEGKGSKCEQMVSLRILTAGKLCVFGLRVGCVPEWICVRVSVNVCFCIFSVNVCLNVSVSGSNVCVVCGNLTVGRATCFQVPA